MAPRRNLQSSRFSRPYRLTLVREAAAILRWAASCSPPVHISFPLSANRANRILISYIQHLYNSRAAVSRASSAVLVFQHSQPSLRSRLRPAWDSVLSWKLEVPLQKRRPLPSKILNVMFLMALFEGLVRDTPKSFSWLCFAVALRVGFHSLLRPGELLALRRGSVSLSADNLLFDRPQAILAIFDPKNKAFVGRAQFARLLDPITLAWVEWLVVGLPHRLRLFPFSPQRFRVLWDHTICALGLQSCGYTPASLRGGGATQLFLDGHSLESIKFAGRWKNMGSLEHYVQEAVSLLTLTRIPPSSQRVIVHMLHMFPHAPSPPPLPWTHFFSRKLQFELAHLSLRRHA